jgi:uncharacterized protein YndB with AHSA1/START domain
MARPTDERRLHLERVLPAPPPQVFGLLIDPLQLARWWGPKGFTTPAIALDARVGGSYRIEMQPPAAACFFLAGEFRRVDPPAHLSYTFRWEPPDPDDQETVVAIELHEEDGSTTLMLDQAPFATEARRALHEQGWTESLDRLRELLLDEQGPQPGE